MKIIIPLDPYEHTIASVKPNHRLANLKLCKNMCSAKDENIIFVPHKNT
jgi:hypothetical protein